MASESQMSQSFKCVYFLTWTDSFISSTGFVHKGAAKYFSLFILSLLKKGPAFSSPGNILSGLNAYL